MQERILPTVFAAFGVAVLAPALANAQADYFKGKSVAIVVGTKTGSFLSAAQIVGRHLGRHIPGNPSVIVRQMPGGGHLNAANYVYNVAEADGLTILAANPQNAMGQLVHIPQVKFDVGKFEWLGSAGSDGVLFAIRLSLPYASFGAFMTSGSELIAGATVPGSNSHDFPLLLKEFAGAKLKLVKGYAANNDILLAIERGEVDGWTALGVTVKQAVDRGSVRALVRARAPVPGFDHLPVDETLTSDPIGKALMAIRGIPLAIGRPYAVRPGTPAERIEALREAFAQTVSDPQLLSEAKIAGIEIRHISATEIVRSFAEMMTQPPHVVAAMGKYLQAAE